ncbi:MAG: hypothetical protein QXL85_07005 [Candidatus Bathyarchaeia archaeon]
MSSGFDLKPLVVLITDGRANVSLSGNIGQEIIELCNRLKEIKARLLVIDVSEDPFTPSYIRDIVKAANAKYLKIESLTDNNLQEIIVNEVEENHV